MRQVNITKLFQKNAFKKFEFEEVLATFPSIGLSFKSYLDLNSFIETESKGGTKGCSIISLPLFSAKRTLDYFKRKYSEETFNSFFKNHPIMIDWETEYWFRCNKSCSKRKEAFSKIIGKPQGWEKLYTIPKEHSNKKHYSLMKKEYIKKLRDFFGDNRKSISLLLSCMRYANQELKSSIVLPPTPLIINTGLSLEYSLNLNRWFNQYRSSLGLISACSYNLHHEAFKQHSTHEKIINQIYELNPKIVVVSTPDSENYLEEYVQSRKKPIFEKFLKELSTYGISSGALIIWHDKGHFTSNHGFRFLKLGFDSFIYPLKGTCKEGGRGNLPVGQRFSPVLDEYSYMKWDKYLTRTKNLGLRCHLKCCVNENYNSLKSLVDRQQWEYKKRHELFTRSEQIKQILEKLDEDGHLDDFHFRLKRNNIQ